MNGTVDVSGSALLLLHFSNGLLKPGGKFAPAGMPEQVKKHRCIENAAAALDAARKAGMLVIYVNAGLRQGFPEVGENACPLMADVKSNAAFLRGTWDADVIDELKPLESEIFIWNFNTSAFSYTELDLILRAQEIRHLFIAGQTTNYIVDSTTRYGVELGYGATILEDCCADYTDEMHNMAMTQILPKLATIWESSDLVSALAGK
jgi:nicotinamidase-related amidase